MGGQEGGLWALPGPIEKLATHATRGSAKKTQFHSNFVRPTGVTILLYGNKGVGVFVVPPIMYSLIPLEDPNNNWENIFAV